MARILNTTRTALDGTPSRRTRSAVQARKRQATALSLPASGRTLHNRVIPDLIDFTKTFFAKHTILNILTRYCIFTSEDMLMVMRPYQITATERILNRIEIANNYKKYGSLEAGGYIWHTTRLRQNADLV